MKLREIIIMDVTIVSGTRMTESCALKERKYNSGDNKEAIKAWKEPYPSQTRPPVISSRGLLYGPSGKSLHYGFLPPNNYRISKMLQPLYEQDTIKPLIALACKMTCKL